MRRGIGDTLSYAGGNPCFSEVTGQTIPGCVEPGANAGAAIASAPAIPSWAWWLAGGLALAVFLGSD